MGFMCSSVDWYGICEIGFSLMGKTVENPIWCANPSNFQQLPHVYFSGHDFWFGQQNTSLGVYRVYRTTKGCPNKGSKYGL